jgi:hypothetical protein
MKAAGSKVTIEHCEIKVQVNYYDELFSEKDDSALKIRSC